MSDLSDQSADSRQPAEELLPAVYAELRRLAEAYVARLSPGQTLQPTALVHEAFLRLVGESDPGWEGRRHFFGAAAQAMRQILIEQARRKGARKRGGDGVQFKLTDGIAYIEPPADDLLALDEAMELLRAERADLAEVVMLRYYSGLSVEETALVVGRSVSTVKREWRFARAWLAEKLDGGAMAEEDAG